MIEKFESETFGSCAMLMKRYEEINEREAYKHKYVDGKIPFFNVEQGKQEYM